MFSVLISVYSKDNAEFFYMALDSLRNQTVLPNEVVLVCDGPLTGELYDVIDKFQILFDEIDVDFVVLKKSLNEGLGLSLKYGSGLCTQSYIMRMDSDDISRPNRIELSEMYLRSHPDVDVLGGLIEEFDSIPGDLKRTRKVPLCNKDIYKFGKHRNPMNHVSVCIKRDSLIAVGNYESVISHEDYYLWSKFLVNGFKLKNVNDCFVDVRVGNDLIGRRKGFSYFKLECYFASKCYNLGYFSLYDCFSYLFPRLIMRVFPSFILKKIYILLRK